MDEKLVKIEELTNDELVKLYQDILQHIKFLNDSIINESDDKNE
ncbi:unknown [Mycoplasma sp. CAG:877]|nr:unknown [Mycoplasma sp. CAG:877]